MITFGWSGLCEHGKSFVEVCVNSGTVEESAAYAKTVVDRVCVTMEESAADAKSAMDRVCVNTKESAAGATSVVDLVCVSLADLVRVNRKSLWIYLCEHCSCGRERCLCKACDGLRFV